MANGWLSSPRWSTVPLPLVQLAQASGCAKTAAERFFLARQLWETCIKLLGCVCLASWRSRQAEPGGNPSAVPSLWRHDSEDFPSSAQTPLAHWWRWVRLLQSSLCNGNEPFALRLRDWLHRDGLAQDSPWITHVQQLFGLTSPSALPRTPATWFEHYILSAAAIAAYEPTPGDPQSYDCKTQALLHAFTELLVPGNFFEQIRWVFLARAEREGDQAYRLERFDLAGRSPRWLPPVLVAATDTTPPPTSGQVYLELAHPGLDSNGAMTASHSRHTRPAPWLALPLYPLVLYGFDTEETLVLHAIHGEKDAIFVSPTTGRTYQDANASEAVGRLAEELINHPVTGELAKKWWASLASGRADTPSGSWLGSHPSTGFELLSEFPCGPDAVQYRAWQLSLRRPVRLQCQLLTEDRQAFAEEELSALYALLRTNDPHLVKVYEHGVIGGVAYVATEFVPGVSLARVMEKLQFGQRQTVPDLKDWYQAVRLASLEEGRQERPLCDLHTYERRLARYLSAARWPDPTDSVHLSGRSYVQMVLELVSQLAESVHVLHETGLAHGSIVPGRILLASEDGRPVLVEPSYRRDIARSPDLTLSLRYLSPERRSGWARVTPQADIYSLAAITSELLALPVDHAVLRDDTAQERWAAQLGLEKELVAFLCQCLSKSPEERLASARVFAQRLRDFAQALTPAPAAGPAVTNSPADKSAAPSSSPFQKSVSPSPQPLPAATTHSRQAFRRSSRWLAVTFFLLGCLAIAPATFCAIAWWVGLQPWELFRLVSHRALPRWLVFGDNMPGAAHTPTSTPSTPGALAADNQRDSNPNDANPVAAAIVEKLEQELAAERQRVQDLQAQLRHQQELVSKGAARIQQLEKLLTASNKEELVNRLRQELQQSQANLATLQQQYQSAEEQIGRLTKQLQAAQLAEKQLREDLAASTLKMETLVAENQALRQTQHLFLEWSPELVQQWLRFHSHTASRHNLAVQARRPYVQVLRDTLANRLKNLDSKQVPPLQLAAAYLMLGMWEHDLGSYESAQAAYKEAWNTLNQLPAEVRQQTDYHLLLYCLHCGSARLYQEHKKYAEAEAAWLQALRALDHLSKTGPEDRWLAEQASGHEHLAVLFRQARQLDKAESAFFNACRLWEKLLSQHPEEPNYALGAARCYEGLAYVAELRDQVDAAHQNYQQALAILENTLQRQPQHRQTALALARVLVQRGGLYRDSGQVRESLGDFQRALELVRPLQGTESSPLDTLATLRDIYAGRAHAYLALRQYAEALRDWDEAIACDWDRSPALRAYRAICLARLRDIERAAAEADRLYQEHPKTGSLLYNLACVHAVIADVLGQDHQKPPEQNPQREAHALQALDLLRQAADLGYFRTPHRLDYLQRDPDLDVLRNREDFKRLLEKLSATP